MSDSHVLYKRDGRLARITLNRPEVLNAINDTLPAALEKAIENANADKEVRTIILDGSGAAFCAGYDLNFYAEASGSNPGVQDMPWDPMKDFAFTQKTTNQIMSIWRSLVPVICKVHGYALAGGSDIALCSDILVISEKAKIGYPPARVWGCPTTAMWVYRLGIERAKRLLLTGDVIDGIEAEKWGLGQAVADEHLDDEVENLAHRMATIPRNQLIMQKMLANQVLENMGFASSQTLATIFDGIARHSPEGINFKKRAEKLGWKKAVQERDEGNFDWTSNSPFTKPDLEN